LAGSPAQLDAARAGECAGQRLVTVAPCLGAIAHERQLGQRARVRQVTPWAGVTPQGVEGEAPEVEPGAGRPGAVEGVRQQAERLGELRCPAVVVRPAARRRQTVARRGASAGSVELESLKLEACLFGQARRERPDLFGGAAGSVPASGRVAGGGRPPALRRHARVVRNLSPRVSLGLGREAPQIEALPRERTVPGGPHVPALTGRLNVR
jgi:hypothetical protein